VNQAELSLHRALADNYTDLMNYYSANNCPQVSDIAERLQQLVLVNSCSLDTNTDWHFLEKRMNSIFYRLVCYVNALPNWYLKGSICLQHYQIKAIYEALLSFSDIVKGSFTPNQDERIKIRMRLANSASIISLQIPNERLVYRARSVEHLNQSEYLKWHSVNEIAGSEWMFFGMN
jgi:hypothetical protein